MFLFDMWKDNMSKEDIVCEGAYDVHSSPIGQHRVVLTYGDLTLIIAMIEDYLIGLETIHNEDPFWKWHIDKFKHISKKIQLQINYNYEKKKEQCEKKKEKEGDIGEEAMILAIKKQENTATKKEQKDAGAAEDNRK